MRTDILCAALVAVPLLAATTVGQNNDGLEWSTYIGGNDVDLGSFLGRGEAIAGNGDVLFGGSTRSTDFPVKHAYDGSYNGKGSRNGGDAILVRLQADGSDLAWSTYFGGQGDERILGLVESPAGVVTVCGWTNSSEKMGFPVTPGAFDTTYNGGSSTENWGDAFVARFVWTGRKLDLVWSTYLGGPGDDIARDLVVHPTGVVVVAGLTYATGFPIRGRTLQGKFGGKLDGFVAVLSADGRQLLSSTYLGGAGEDGITSLILDAAGNPLLTGFTEWSAFPTTPNAFQPRLVGQDDGFIMRMAVGLDRVLYATLLGGTTYYEWVSSAVVTPSGTIVAAGTTPSSDHPVTADAFDRTYNGGTYDGYITVLDPGRSDKAQLVWSTFVGGSDIDVINDMAMERSGLITVTGSVRSTDFPTTAGTYQAMRRSPNYDAFVTRFDPVRSPANKQLVYSTYLGGKTSYAYGYSVALDGMGNAVVVGTTRANDFPTTGGAFDTTYNDNFSGDVFVSKLTTLPRGVQRHGWSTPACVWPIYQGAAGWPKPNTDFSVRATGAAPNAPGLLAFGPTVNNTGYPVLNARAFVNPPLLVLPMKAGANGYARIGWRIPASVPKGTKAALQWLFETTPRCPGTGLFSTSEALEITIQ